MSPQLENGYFKIATEIYDAFSKYRIPGEERQVLDFIIRKTYGFHKKRDYISNSQFVDGTGISKQNVNRSLRSLIEKNIVIKKDYGNSPTYEFNKKYKDWKLSSKRTTVVKIDYTSSQKRDPQNIYIQKIKDIVVFLNEKTGKNFKTTSKTTQRHISARLNEGFTVEDFKRVIEKKTEQWKDDKKMNAYLRPETLFGTKFESYLQEDVKEKKEVRVGGYTVNA